VGAVVIGVDVPKGVWPDVAADDETTRLAALGWF
jgi:hypothetical protein